MTDEQLLEKVKTGIGAAGIHNDPNLLLKVKGAKGYMTRAGLTTTQIESDLGIVTLTVLVTDFWNVQAGAIDFSPAADKLIEMLR